MIVALNERPSALDEVRAYDAGIDEYFVQPLEPIKIRARLHVLVRRVEVSASTTVVGHDRVAVGDLLLNFAAREVHVAGTAIALTPTEYVLLETLAREQGRFVPTAISWSGPGARRMPTRITI